MLSVIVLGVVEKWNNNREKDRRSIDRKREEQYTERE
jgi:hypothetical protein